MHCCNLLSSFQQSVINLSPFSLVECQRGCLSDTDWGQDWLEHTDSLTLRQNPSSNNHLRHIPDICHFLNRDTTFGPIFLRIIILYSVQRIRHMTDGETGNACVPVKNIRYAEICHGACLANGWWHTHPRALPSKRWVDEIYETCVIHVRLV